MAVVVHPARLRCAHRHWDLHRLPLLGGAVVGYSGTAMKPVRRVRRRYAGVIRAMASIWIAITTVLVASLIVGGAECSCFVSYRCKTRANPGSLIRPWPFVCVVNGQADTAEAQGSVLDHGVDGGLQCSQGSWQESLSIRPDPAVSPGRRLRCQYQVPPASLPASPLTGGGNAMVRCDPAEARSCIACAVTGSAGRSGSRADPAGGWTWRCRASSSAGCRPSSAAGCPMAVVPAPVPGC